MGKSDTDKITLDKIKFEGRKQDHIRLALDNITQSTAPTGLDEVTLFHEALPEMDFDEVDLSTTALGVQLGSPFLISSMTAGHPGANDINIELAKMAEEFGWLMGVGSQRRQLMENSSGEEWRELRRRAPGAHILGNLGLTQLITHSTDQVIQLVESLGAIGVIIHTNPLQEVLQPEGTPEFRGGLKALERLCHQYSGPVVLKEVGCGFSPATLNRLKDVGIQAIDISGTGGTHWGRIEGLRSPVGSIYSEAAQTFANWGVSTVASLRSAASQKLPFEIWASGGVRSGLDAAKLLSLGAQMVGLAQPLLKAALEGPEALRHKFELLEFELKCALFCTGSANPRELREISHAKV